MPAPQPRSPVGFALEAADLADLVATAAIGVHCVGHDGTILWANPADHAMFGYAEDEYVGRNLAELHVETAVVDDMLARLRRGERLSNVPAALRHKDGTVRHVLVTSSARFDETGAFAHARCFTLDVTERHRTERSLQHADERLRVALEAAAMGTWEWDVAGGRVHGSSALEAIHGLPPGGFDGTFEAFARDIHPDDRERVLARIERSLAGEDHRLEYRIVRPDGEVRWLEAHGRLLRDDLQRPSKMLGVCMDVTARKREELERSEMSAELGKVAGFRERLLGIVAHDLRNPLAAITASAAVVRECGELSPRHLEGIDRILRGGERMARIVSDLLDFTYVRLGAGIPVRAQPMDMATVVARIVEEHEAADPGRAIALVTDGDARGSWDPERAAQVVANLIGNAVQHGEGPVRVSVTGAADAVVVRVTNGGAPIDPRVLPELFQPFARGNRHGPGLGLGLYIVSDIVRAHCGTIDLESTTELGTCVTVRWPRT